MVDTCGVKNGEDLYDPVVESAWDSPGLVPPQRLGALLSEARSGRGLTLEEIAYRSDGAISLARLSSVERGSTQLGDDEVALVARLYGLDATSIVPARSKLIVDLNEGTLEIAGRRDGLGRTAVSRDEVMARYLAMVYSMRQVPPGTAVPLRLDDLDVLGRSLHMGAEQLRIDLDRLMAADDDLVARRHRSLRTRVLLPAAGILVAFCGVGALVLVQGAAAQQTNDRPSAVVTVAPPQSAVVGTAVVQERNADGTPGPIVERNGP